MKFNRKEGGVAGLTLLLSLITMLFIIGLLVMIFALMGEGMLNAGGTSAVTGTVTNETGSWINETTYTVSGSGANGFRSLVITALYNATDDSVIGTGNVTVSGAGFTNATVTNWADVLVSYTYVYDVSSGLLSTDSVAYGVINGTVDALASVIDWFPLFIVIGAMVVLILLTVIIIIAIRGSGLIAGGEGASA